MDSNIVVFTMLEIHSEVPQYCLEISFSENRIMRHCLKARIKDITDKIST